MEEVRGTYSTTHCQVTQRRIKKIFQFQFVFWQKKVWSEDVHRSHYLLLQLSELLKLKKFLLKIKPTRTKQVVFVSKLSNSTLKTNHSVQQTRNKNSRNLKL